MAITKEQIVNDLLAVNYEIDGKTDWNRIQAFVAKEYKVRLSHDAFWAVFNALKQEGLATLDFN